MKTHILARGLVAAAFSATMVFGTSDASADEREQCASSADRAQQFRDEGKYRRAREQMLSCARDVCPGPIKRDCLEWLTQLDNVAPTIVFAAKDKDQDLVDVKVSMDGTPVVDRLDGKPVPVDVGEHVFRFEYKGAVREEKVVIGAGQKSRNIRVSFGAADTTTPGTPPVAGGDKPKKEEGSLVPALVAGGIGVVALGSFAFFGLSGKGAVDDLEAKQCKPHCSQDEVDSAKSKLLIADVSLGVGIVALGVATYLFVTREKAEPAVSTAAGLNFDMAPLPGGARAAIGARF